jgi:serine/threonine-protein kinase
MANAPQPPKPNQPPGGAKKPAGAAAVKPQAAKPAAASTATAAKPGDQVAKVAKAPAKPQASQETKVAAQAKIETKQAPADPEDLTATRATPGVSDKTEVEDLVSTQVKRSIDDRTEHVHISETDKTRVGSGANTMADDKSSESSGASTPALAEDAKADNLSTLKDFRLITKLGEGGMGAVYKAHQMSLDRICAVKVPFRHLAKDASFVGRFYREARIMAKLDHPNILRCFGVGEENGWHYLAMEYIDGASMQSWVKKLGKLSVGDALHVAIACAHALQHAHEQDLIHRDVKPDNILITSKGAVKVADMGLAKALTDDLGLSRTGTGAGTPHYMAPEQARDAKHVDHRCDIYALGCMLHTFLTGKPPFSAETYVELLVEKDKGKFQPARRSNPEVPERLDMMIDKAMAPKLELRYKSCGDFAKDLESLGLANEILSFVPGATVSNLPRGGGPATQAALTKTVPQAVKPAAPTAGKPGMPTAKAGEIWYIALKSSSGKVMKRKLSTFQLIEMMKRKDFDLNALLSRSLKGPYRNLNYYKEFEHVLMGRLEQAKADKKAAKYQGMYEKIIQEEKSWKFKKWFRDLRTNVTGWITFGIMLAAIAGVGYAVWVFYGPQIMKFMGFAP